MKTNYKRLNVLLAWFPDAFYSITISEYGIDLQGKFHSNTVRSLLTHGFNPDGYSNGYAEFNRDNIHVTLTE